MDDLERYLAEQLRDPEFRAAWEEQEPERELTRKLIEARIANNMTQAELARACGMRPSNLCRIETGNGNPSLTTLKRIAKGLGRKLVIDFV